MADDRRLTLFISSLILFIAGLYTYGFFFQFILPKNGNLQIINTSLNEQFRNHMYYSVLFGLLPFTLYLTWRFGNIDSIKKRIITTLIFIMSIVLALLLRLYMIHLVSEFVVSDKILNTMTVDSLKFIQFMFIGLLLGMLFSWIILRQKTDKI